MIKKINKKEKDVLLPELFNQEIVMRDGIVQKIGNILNIEDVWTIKRKGRKIDVISKIGMQKLADSSGISKSFDADLVQPFPSPYNNQAYNVKVKIRCLAKEYEWPIDEKNKVKSCIHGLEREVTATGEVNRLNAGSFIGIQYPRIMAEKRGYISAVKNHLGIMNAYGEEEAEAFEEKIESDDITGEEYESIANLVNAIYSAKNKVELSKVAKIIKNKKNDLNEAQLKALRKHYNTKIKKPFTLF